MPRLFWALISVGLAGTIIGGLETAPAQLTFVSAFHELLIGIALAMPFQYLFAGLYIAGRAVDIQSGLGMALVLDPSSRSQAPLVGTIIAYLACCIFFSSGGTGDVLRIVAGSLRVVPLGMPSHPGEVATVAAQLTTMCTLSFGLVGGIILALFLTDMIIAVLARSVPQMNALMIGIQVKVLVLLALLPIVLGLSGALLARMIALTLQAMPRLI